MQVAPVAMAGEGTAAYDVRAWRCNLKLHIAGEDKGCTQDHLPGVPGSHGGGGCQEGAPGNAAPAFELLFPPLKCYAQML